MRQFINYIWYKGIEWYTNRAIFFYVIYTETLLPSGAGFRMLVVMSCGRGHAMYHILSHSDLHFAFLFYFLPHSVFCGGATSPRGPIFPIPNSTRMRYSEFYQRFFPTYLLDLCISGDRLDLSSYSYTPVSSSLCHSFYHFCQKCEIYTSKPFCIQADVPFHPAYKNSQIIRPKLSIKEEFITNRKGMEQ